MVNYDAIQKKFPKLDVENLKEGLEVFGISDRDEIVALLAQLSQESGDFAYLSENLNYSAKSLANTWPNRFKDKSTGAPNEKALSIARNPEKIANSVYSNRMGNGDEASGDGWKYRGRGYIQLTGKTQYQTIGKELEKYGLLEDAEELVEDPDKLKDPKYALYSALAYWKVNNCGSLVHNFTALTRRINGGTIGLQDRIARRDKINEIA